MTKKTYIIFVKALARMIDEFISILKEDNPKFDEKIFREKLMRKIIK